MTSRQGFQTQVNVQPAPAVEGDFASTNPRFSVLAGPGGLVSGPAGVTIGRFCWITQATTDADGAPANVNSFGAGAVAGFVHREQQGLIVTYLIEAGMTIQQGFPMTVMSGGDFWARNAGSAQALPGQKAYATLANGAVTFGATGAATLGTLSGSLGPQTATFVGSIAGGVLTVSSLATGTIQPGGAITGGTGMAASTTIVSQLSGTIGGVGTYSVTPVEQLVSAALITETYGLLTVASVSSGTLTVGALLSGGTLSAGTTVTALLTGAGGAGTYVVNLTQTAGTQSMNFTTNVETKWVAMSSGLAGELVKISDHVLG